MTAFRHLRATLATTALAVASSGTWAHTGHGHDDFGSLDGLLHAMSEPDHLAMLAAGVAFTAWLAPRVLRAIRRLLQLRRERRQAAAVARTQDLA